MAVFGIDNPGNRNDEIKTFQLGRYLSSSEGAWRIFGFNIHERYPAVEHLSIHLENEQTIYYTEDSAKEKVLNPPNTTLLAFFNLCQTDEFANCLLYHEVPTYYTWNKSKRQFIRRIKGSPLKNHPGIRKSDTIGRVYTVHPNNFECYFLRMLLHKVRGPQCFNDLKTYEGTLYSTYREACMQHGLLENDNQWEIAISEAALTSTSNQLRNLYSIILTSCNPSNPIGKTTLKT